MPSYLWRPQANTDNAQQQENGGTFGTTNTELRIRSDPSGNTTLRYHSAIRFIGTIPAGTKVINKAILRGRFSSVSNDPNCRVYLQSSAAPTAFASSAGNNVVSRPYNASSYFSWVVSDATSNANWEIDLTQIFQNFLEEVGGADFSDPENIQPTTVNIVNPVLLFRPNVATASEARMVGFDGTSISNRYLLPTLDINYTLDQPVLDPSDKRVHIATITDSYGWSLQPGTPRDPGLRFTFAANVAGVAAINTTGLVEFTDKTPGGYFTIREGDKDYAISRPDLGYMPEGRQGFTEDGILKDRICDKLGVNRTDVVMHPFGLGGTTIWNNPHTYGSWTSRYSRGQPYEALNVNLDPADPNLEDELINELWQYVDETGVNLIQLLRDTTIERLLIVQTGSGNDALQHGIDDALLPMNKGGEGGANRASWNNVRDKVRESYKIFINFCRQVRAAAGGSEIEWIIMGYPNMPVQDTRIDPIVVHDTEPNNTPFHRGFYPGIDNPDDEYGGPYGTNGKMAPYATPLGDHTPNAIPQVPHLLQYSLWPSSAISTNIPDVTISGPWPRPMKKSDLGYDWQLKAFMYFNKTFENEWSEDGPYEYWYAHWAADHYSHNTGFPSIGPVGGDQPNYQEKNRWINARDAWSTINFNSWYFPYPASAENNQILPGFTNDANSVMNLKVAVPFCIRHVTQDNVNEVLQHVTLGTEDAVKELYTEAAQANDTSLQVQYVNLFDSLGSAIGNGIYASASGEKFIDGAHLTEEASIEWVDAMLEKAVPKSPMLQTLTDWSPIGIARFMQFFTDGSA